MGFAIGFGSTEQAFEDAEERAFKDYARQLYLERGCDYVTSELAAAIREWLEARAKEHRDRSASFRTASEFPDRYSDYYAYILSDGTFVVAIFRFSHTNRRHALSPDGWALMQTERLACFNATRDV